jgi:hypothetical protein
VFVNWSPTVEDTKIIEDTKFTAVWRSVTVDNDNDDTPPTQDKYTVTFQYLDEDGEWQELKTVNVKAGVKTKDVIADNVKESLYKVLDKGEYAYPDAVNADVTIYLEQTELGEAVNDNTLQLIAMSAGGVAAVSGVVGIVSAIKRKKGGRK